MTLPAGHSYEDGVCTVCGKYDPSMMKYSDVTENDYFYEALLWAVIYGIPDSNTGVFGVNVGSTRAEVVTYLWRASGCPTPKSYNGVFTDISSTAYYFKAVQWAVEQGITAGTGGYEFSPSRICTRAEVVALLWRAAGRPSIADLNMKERKRLAIISFEDVNADAYYFEAVQWAIAKGITAGTDATHFSPDLNCTRSQIVMFLYADLG